VWKCKGLVIICKQKRTFLPYAVIERLIDIIDDIHINKLGDARIAKKSITAFHQKANCAEVHLSPKFCLKLLKTNINQSFIFILKFSSL